MIVLKNIYKKYKNNKKYILKNINLNFKDNGFVSILGESGAGKTTLLNIISGIDSPTKGNIYINREDINNLIKDNSLYNQYISFIFQNYNLIEKISVNDNIKLINDIKIKNILKKLRIENKEKSKISELSGGQKQRVAIARALAKNNKILICDEPTGALDSNNSKNIMQLLKKISKTKLVIMVTHNEELAKTYSDRIITLKDGEVISDTSPLELEERNNKHKKIKEKYSILNILKIIKVNIKSNKRKNITTIISLIIGLVSLISVLGISIGFKNAILKEEKTTLSSYPLIINEYSSNPLDSLKQETKYTNKIKGANYIHRNKIDDKLIEYIKSNKHTSYIKYNYVINNINIFTTDKSIEQEIILKKGNYPDNKELLLVVDEFNNIDKYILESINLNKEEYGLEELVNHKVKINRVTYKISGIATFKESSPMFEETGIYINELGDIPSEIYLYPKSYNDKLDLIKYLDEYKQLKYLDQTDTVKEVLTTLISSITIVLTVFSIIILIVSSIMIYILTYISIIERNKEISIYKVNGINNKIIKLIFYLENIIISLIALIISIIISCLLSTILNNIFLKITSLENIMLINKEILTVSLIITLLLTTVSTLIPLRKINKIRVVDILRNN